MLSIGTDFSGIEAPIQALRKLKIPYRHVWACENDKYALKSIQANYKPERIYTDIRERNHAELPTVDLYVAGFPCQPFSNIGNRTGEEHKKGDLFMHVLETIRAAKPKFFILENVKPLLKFETVVKKIKDAITALGYKQKWKVLNALDFNLPQNRERVWIVGYTGDEWQWPEPVPLTNTIDKIVNNDIKGNVSDRPNWVERKADKYNVKSGDIKTIASHCKRPTENKIHCLLTHNNVWYYGLERILTPSELLQCQGFPADFKIVVSRTQIHKQAGNSMPVNVLAAIISQLS